MTQLRFGALAGLLGFSLLSSAALADDVPLVKTSNRQTALVQAIQKVRPSVVNIHSQKSAPARSLLPSLGQTRNNMSGMGTGVIVDERGYIVTNYHVIEDVSTIRVTLVDGSTSSAEVVARDPETDLALLRIEPKTSLPVMPMGFSEDLMYGETTIAIGNAFGYEHTITRGVISELHRDVRLSEDQAYHDLIQTDASINPGNSGGPLINADGEMIGLNVAIRANAQGIGFAIPTRDVKLVLARLMSAKKLANVHHGLAVKTAEFNDNNSGRVLVQSVDMDGAADKAGIRPGDRLISLGDRTLQFAYDVERACLGHKPGDSLKFTALRGGAEVKGALTLGRASVSEDEPADYIYRRMGVRLAGVAGRSDVRQVSSQLSGGLKIVEVAQGRAGQQGGLQAGDILVGLHQYETLTLANVVFVLNEQQKKELNPVRYFVIRNGVIVKGWLSVPRDE